MSLKRPDGSPSHEIARIPVDYPTVPVTYEPVLGDYYGRAPSNSAVARSYLQLFLRQLKSMTIIFMLIMLAGMLWLFTRPRLYSATAEMMVTHEAAPTEARLLLDIDLIHEAFASLPKDMRWKGFATHESTLAKYPYTVSVPKDTDIVSIEVIARDPNAAAAFANKIVVTDIKKNASRVSDVTAQAVQPLVQEISQSDRELDQALTSMERYKHTHNISDLGAETSANAQGLANQSQLVNDAEREVAQQQAQRTTIEQHMRDVPRLLVQNDHTPNTLLQSIDMELEQLQQKREDLRQEFQPTAQEVRNVDEQIAQARHRREVAQQNNAPSSTSSHNPVYDNLAQQHINVLIAEQDARARVTLARAQLVQMRAHLSDLPDVEKQMSLLTGHVEEMRNKLTDLRQQERTISANTYTELPSVTPTMVAHADFRPVSPRYKTSMLLLFVVALAVAFGFAALRGQLDDRFHSREMLEEVSGQRVLASLPHVRNGFRGLVTQEECPATLLESFRILRANVLLALRDPRSRIITVTSPQAGEGKSTTVVNLASMIAMSGKRVLVVDCDLRHPSVHLYFGLENNLGLTSVLQGTAPFEECLQQVDGERLQVLTAGPTHSPELLVSAEMAALLTTLQDRYDCILLDSPPLLNLSDGVLLAALAHAAVLVVSFDRTRQPHLQEATRILANIGIPILGVVHNRSTEAPSPNWLAKKG